MATFGRRPAFVAVTVDRVVDAAGVAKGTFHYHFQSMDDLAAVDAKLADSFDELLAPTMHEKRDPIARLSFAFTKFLDKAVAFANAGRVRSRDSSPSQGGLTQAIAEGRVSIKDSDLAADIVIGIWLQVGRGG